MERIKTEIDIKNIPEKIRHFLKGAAVYDSSCHSSAKVYYIDSGYYLKIDNSGSLADEARLNNFFHARGLGVEVLEYLSEDQDYLVTRSADGEDLIHCLDDPEKVCEILAESLRILHSQPIDHMPVSARHQKYQTISGNNPKATLKKDTLIHGDACLPNIIQKNKKFQTFIDVGMAGAGDRHIDLYWAIWSLRYNFETDQYTNLFLDMYGREKINEERLQLIAGCEQLIENEHKSNGL